MTNAEQPLSRNFSVALQPMDSARDSGKEEICDSDRERQIPQKFVIEAVIVSHCAPGPGPNSVMVFLLSKACGHVLLPFK